MGKDSAGIYWAYRIQPGSCQLCHLFNLPITAKQRCQKRKIPDSHSEYQMHWLDGEMLDIIFGLFLIAVKSERFNADVIGIKHTVSCFQIMEKNQNIVM